MSNNFDPKILRRDGDELGKAIAQEAVVRCTDPVYGQMVTEVIFCDTSRATEVFHPYMEDLFAMAGVVGDEYFPDQRAQDIWEEALFDALNAAGALDDRTVGPY